MTIRQAIDRVGYKLTIYTSVAILFVAGVTYSEIGYAETHPRVVDYSNQR